jgi:hypothetical protein
MLKIGLLVEELTNLGRLIFKTTFKAIILKLSLREEILLKTFRLPLRILRISHEDSKMLNLNSRVALEIIGILELGLLSLGLAMEE